MEEGEDKGKICVTGGTGFIASWLIKRLLQHGYSVTTTIRPDPEHKRDISFLTNLLKASEKLQIFQADLSEPESFEPAIIGCTGVFHVATPVDFEEKETEEVVTKRSVEGALGILKACLKSKTVKRVVYTSSASTVAISEDDMEIRDERFWSNVVFIRSNKSKFGGFANYMISKTVTEKKALEFAEENGLDLVTIIPTFVHGPFICPKLPGSVRSCLALLLGKEDEYGILVNVSMVRNDDVARAHIFLFENPDVKGRYICSSHTITIEELWKFLSAKYPQFPIPTMESLKDIIPIKAPGMSSKKLLDSGFEYKYGLDEMFDDAIQSCKEKGYL